MKISVIIPVYNRAKELKRALESLEKQTFKDFETIVVDDGSDGDYSDVLNGYNGSKLIFLQLEHTGNIAHVRNEGIKHASGDYVAVLDSDDFCDAKRLEIQKKELDESLDIDVLATWVNVVGNDYNDTINRLTTMYNKIYDTEGIIYQNLNYGCCICHSSVMIRKSVLEKLGGYDENYGICEDYKLWMDCIIEGYVIKVLPEKLTYRTLHEDSVTSSYEGSDEAISKVISIKLKYLFRENRNIQKITILGESKRNDIIIPLIKKYIESLKELTVLNVYGSLPKDINSDYIFVSTFSGREKVFDYLKIIGKKPVSDYIYL